MSVVFPVLTAADLRGELRRVHAKPHRTLTTAFFGVPATGMEDVQVELPPRGSVRFDVVHASCELQARKALASSRAGENANLVLLFDYEGRLPLDVASRLAGGRVRTVTDERRLAHLFRAQSVTTEVLASPLRAALLSFTEADFSGLSGTTLDLETAWRKFLARMAGLPEEAPLSEERVISHCAMNPNQTGFRKVLAGSPGLREGLQQFIGERAGPVARLAWRAWENERGLEVAAFAFILQSAISVLDQQPYLEAWLTHRLGKLDSELKDALTKDRSRIEQWAGLADRLSLQFRDEAGLDQVLAEAEKLLDDQKARQALGWSAYLPSALKYGTRRMATALKAALDEPSAKRLEEMRVALEALERHRLRGQEPHRCQIDHARMAARLCAFLGVADAPLPPAPAEQVCELALFYAREGGFLDLARTQARGGLPQDELDEAIVAVVARADSRRDELDERFVRALPAWLGHPKTDRVLPIEKVLDRLCVDFLAGGDHRRLLVLLLDGMAWTDAVQLLLSLGESHWGPVRWQPKGASGELLPPVLAALPTLTDVSRSALFGGKRLKPGEARNSTADPDRFDGHPGLRKLIGHGPQLLLRSDAEVQTGHASPKALELVRSEARVVGIVLNAIDDQLSVGSGLDVSYSVQSIKALQYLLVAAAEAHRAILLLSDHGHVRGDRFTKTLAKTVSLSARARELKLDETPLAGELVVEDDSGWRAKAKNRLAMLYREEETFGSLNNRGAHGGASLAEVVTPALLVAPSGLAESMGLDDRGLELRSFPRPGWWDLKLPQQASAPLAPVQKKKVAAEPVSAQLPLLSKPVRAMPAGRLVGLLQASESYQASNKVEREFWEKNVLPVVALLEEHGGNLVEDVFAARLELLRFRIPSLVAELSMRLNVDQHLVLVHDRAKGLVRLDCTLLEQLFTE